MTNHALAAAFASEVRAEMGRQRKSRTEMSHVLGVHPATGRARLEGETPFTLPESSAVCEWLGVSLTEMVARAEAAVANRKPVSA